MGASKEPRQPLYNWKPGSGDKLLGIGTGRVFWGDSNGAPSATLELKTRFWGQTTWELA